MGRKFFTASIATLLTTFTVQAADLDVEGARRRYEAQKRIAEAARSRMELGSQRLQEALNRLSQAEADDRRAHEMVHEAESNLKNIDDSITRLEREINENLTEISEDKRKLQGFRKDLKDAIFQKERFIEPVLRETTRRLKETESKIAKLEADSPDSPELPRLREQRDKLTREVADAKRQLDQKNGEIAGLERTIRNMQQHIDDHEEEIRDAQAEISRLQRDRDRALHAIQDAKEELRRVHDRLEAASEAADRARADYQQLEREYQREEAAAGELYAYYQVVVDNYNKALAEVYRAAELAAREHSRREGTERGSESGKAEGIKVGIADGTTKGTSDGAVRNRLKGYREGRLQGATDPLLGASFQDGEEMGNGIANQKALAENFPLGYNDALRALLASTPANLATVDISDDISSLSGGNGVFLRPTPKSVGAVAPPAYPDPKDPPFTPPSFKAPGVQVPSTLKTYYNPPCAGLVLAEFEPLCRQKYDELYRSGYASTYQTVYRETYRQHYVTESSTAYDIHLNKQNTAEFSSGRTDGARDAGILVGFANSIENAKVAKFNEGKQTLANSLKSGALVVYRGSQLEETSGDGLFTPGEPLKVSITIDNLGLEATARAKARLRVTGVNGVGTFSVLVRELPALEANTRTTLTGVVSAPITTEFPGQQIQVDAAFEGDIDGNWVQLFPTSATAETHFPLELSEVTLPKAPNVDESINAVMRYTNRTRETTAARAFTLSTAPKVIEIPNPVIQVPELGAGQTADVTVNLKPGYFVGENTYVRFLSDSKNADGVLSRQAYAKFIHMNRWASILLFDKNGKAIPSSTLRVQAGTRFGLAPKLVFHGKQTVNGPFTLRAAGTSDKAITIVGGSTTSQQHQSLSPNYNFSPMPIGYSVPASLKGKSGWVMFELMMRNTVLHRLPVYLKVE